MAKKDVDDPQLRELLCQALETEAGGIKLYEAALGCVVNDDLKKEWEEYLDQTRNHHQVLLGVFEELGMDPQAVTPGRQVVGHIGTSLLKAMQMAQAAGAPEAAERVAAECIVLAESKDHMNWELIGHAAERMSGKTAAALKKAHEAVEHDEDHHLYHTKGWARELWLHALGFPAVLPPPEEVKQVETAIGAARAEQTRSRMLRGRRH
jgi:rubrerythrin